MEALYFKGKSLKYSAFFASKHFTKEDINNEYKHSGIHEQHYIHKYEE